ncbi:MAG: FAD-dependent oxidoreductase [Pseudomonadota bacterium]
MFLDPRDLLPGQSLTADVAVVGAGPAGLALALALARAGRSVLLLESGGMRPDAASDALNAGTSNLTDYPFQTSRARAFGGATTRWFGACVPLDEDDFTPRAWVPYSGWPIGAGDIAQDMGAARAFFGLPARSDYEDALEEHPLATAGLAVKPVLFSQPNDLGQAYRDDVRGDPNIRCILGVTITQLAQSAPGQISGLVARHPGGSAFDITAGAYVLAAGGLETPRLLLASRDQAPNGVGNTHDVVGRYHMEHPIRSVGVVSLARPGLGAGLGDFTEIRRHGDVRAQATLGLSAPMRRAHGLLDMHARAYRFHPLEADPAVIAAKALLGRPPPDGADRRLSATLLARGLGKIARYGAWHYRQKLFASTRPEHLRLLAFVEQEPDPENRITLSDQTDRFGTPLPHLSYAESTVMTHSLERTLHLMDAALRQAGVGALHSDPTTLAALKGYDSYGLHPMGSTRMSDDARMGVVDANLKVHGVANLFVVGSSVFPTGGAANPTLTIVALALRLARHLARLRSN